jgi:hypothetical protein
MDLAVGAAIPPDRRASSGRHESPRARACKVDLINKFIYYYSFNILVNLIDVNIWYFKLPAMCLRIVGHSCGGWPASFSDGYQAIEFARRWRPEKVLLDVAGWAESCALRSEDTDAFARSPARRYHSWIDCAE